MKKIFFLLLLVLAGSSISLFAQDTLPKFSVRNVGNNRYIIGWVNNFENVTQISIQRSHDSLKNYKTILSVADPKAKQNGFADTKAPNDHMYYRLFIVFDKGQYLFSEAKKPVLDTAKKIIPVVEKVKDIKDTAVTVIKPVIEKPKFVPSFYVYTNKDGYVFINLPDADKEKYRIKFFEEDDSFLFEIKNIKETGLTLDKTNFLHAGWFKFELYNDEKLVEKNKFYLAKDF
jgi:hypothetical protein